MTSEILKIVVKEIAWLLFAILLFLLVSFLSLFILIIIEQIFSVNITTFNNEVSSIPFLFFFFVQLLALLICSLWRGRTEGDKLNKWKENKKNLSLIKLLGLGIFTGFVLATAVYLQEIILYQFFDEGLLTNYRWNEINSFSLGAKFIFLLLAGIGAPIVEELYFREAMLGSIHRRGFPNFAMFFSCAVFGIIHLNFMHIFAYLIYGVGFSLLFIKTSSLIPSIAAHILINTLILYIFLFT
jgi:membrane protease YdiL (CAAX protease family)